MKLLIYSKNDNMVKKTSFDLASYKEKLVATKPTEINDIDSFISAFHDISTALVETDSSPKMSILKLDTMTIWFTRALQLSKIIQGFLVQFYLLERAAQLTVIFNYICQVYETGNAPFTNAASGLLSKLLQFTNKVCVANGNKSLVIQFSEVIMSIPSTQKSFSVISENFLKDMDGSVSALSNNEKSFPEKCLEVMWSSALANSASKAFTSFYTRLHAPKNDTELYIQAWSTRVEKSLNIASERANIISYLLPKLFRPCPSGFLDWVKSLKITKGTENWRVLMLPLLNCAYTISPSNDPIASEVLSQEELLLLLKNSDEYCRRDAFALVCSSVSATKGPPKYALDVLLNPSILRVFFRETITPESRSDFYSLLRKALLNCREFIITQEKRLIKKPDGELEANVQILKSRLRSLYDFTVSQIIPDSSYPQLALSADIIRFFVDYEFDGVERGIKRDVKSRLQIFEIYSLEFIGTLLRFASNNYEDVRLQCSYILNHCPLERFEGVYRQDMMENTLALLSSLKGRQSDGGAQVIKSVAQIYLRNEKPNELFGCLHMILSNMNSCIKADLSVHGHFTAIGEILSLISPMFYENHQLKLGPIIASLLHTSFQMWEIIKPQMTLAPSKIEDESDSEAWRSVKENSFLLKTILTLNASNQWKVFDQDIFLNICDLLMDQLSNISHRGAFSAIYPTFVQACELCYGTNLNNKPGEWLEANLKLLETKEQLISRRSAGLPFLLTAILNSCGSDEEKLQSYLDTTFSEIFRVAQIEYIPSVDEKNDLPQVHAFNCMRCIFKESSLSLSVPNFVEKALELSLTYLDHPAWAIKNGAVMLFTALQERIFGSHKLGEITPSRNAALFFGKYSSIKNSLLEKLENSENFNDIFLVLSILLRLQTFSESDKTLDPFVDIIIEKILGHQVWKIREMAAKLLCMMTHNQEYSRVIEKLGVFDGISRNEIHGRLICLLEFTAFAKRSKLDYYPCLKSVENWFLKVPFKCCWINSRAALLILIKGKLSDEVVQVLKSRVQDVLVDNKLPLNGPRRLFIESAVTAILQSCGDKLEAIELSLVYLKADPYEIQLATLEYWMDKCADFANVIELHNAVIDVINDDHVWNHVKAKCLSLLVSSNVSISKPLKLLENWTDSMKSFGVVVEARLKHMNVIDICESAIKSSADSLPEESRLFSVLTCKSLLRDSTENEQVAAKALFLLYEKLSDEASHVRSLACTGNTCAEFSRELVLNNLAQRYPKEAFNIFVQYVENSVMMNLKDFRSEQANTQFEIERWNLFRNEVDVLRELTEKLSEFSKSLQNYRKLIEEVSSRCITSVWELVEANGDLILSWTFNEHLDSAIRKILVLEKVCSEESKSEIIKIREMLRTKHYYI